MKDTIRITTDLPKELVEFVQKHKKETGISKARIYAEALKLFKEKVEKGNWKDFSIIDEVTTWVLA